MVQRLVLTSWPIVRYVAGFALVGVAVWVLVSHGDELSGLPDVLKRLSWGWVLLAVLAELLSYICFARMQLELLRSGGLDVPMFPLVKMTFAAQALGNSLPGGTAVSAVYGFRWFRRFGASNGLAGWSAAGTVVASGVSLTLVAAIGLALAASQGASLDLVPAIVGTLLIAIGLGALFVYERPLFVAVSALLRASRRISGKPRGDTSAQIERVIGSITSVRLTWRQIGRILLWGTSNWLFDCACFAMMFPAIHSPIPWEGLLLAYGAGQLAAALPITPGGLGAVEGSITIALVEFGGAQVATVDAVLLYRLVSFWLVLLVGWAICGELAFEVRAGRWRRQALLTPVEAGPGSEAVSQLPGSPQGREP